MAFTQAVSRMYIWVRLYLGTAIVMIIKMIAITISNAMSEKPRRRDLRVDIRFSEYYDAARGVSVQPFTSRARGSLGRRYRSRRILLVQIWGMRRRRSWRRCRWRGAGTGSKRGMGAGRPERRLAD